MDTWSFEFIFWIENNLLHHFVPVGWYQWFLQNWFYDASDSISNGSDASHNQDLNRHRKIVRQVPALKFWVRFLRPGLPFWGFLWSNMWWSVYLLTWLKKIICIMKICSFWWKIRAFIESVLPYTIWLKFKV